MTEPDDDESLLFTYLEITTGGDPGHLGDDEPEIRPLCRKCVRELPADDSGLCEFCLILEG